MFEYVYNDFVYLVFAYVKIYDNLEKVKNRDTKFDRKTGAIYEPRKTGKGTERVKG